MQSPHPKGMSPHPVKVEQLQEKMNQIRSKLGGGNIEIQKNALSAALRYCEAGYLIIPLFSISSQGHCLSASACSSPGKHPMTKNGLLDASSDPLQAKTWFGDSLANIGLVTGRQSGIVVLDIDFKNGGSMSLIEQLLPSGFETLTVETGNGLHLYFKHPGFRIKNKANIRPGIDFRGDGGYVVAPPSLHQNGKHYRWKNHHEIEHMPEKLIELLKPKTTPKPPDSKTEGFLSGSRNNSLTRVAGFLKNLNIPEYKLQTSMQTLNEILCSPPLPEDEVSKIVKSINGYKAPRPWKEPCTLPQASLSVSSLPVSALPEKIAPAMSDISERMQVPLEFVSGPALVAAASIIGRKAVIYPMRFDEWAVIPNLWGMIVADPGSMKSPALTEALKPLEQLARKNRSEYLKKLESFDSQHAELQVKITELKNQINSNQGGSQSLSKKLTSLLDQQRHLKKPKEVRYKTNDPTVEKLANILMDNPQGILLFRDELSGWIEKLSRSNQKGDKEFYLETWSGDSSYTVDRIERGTVHVEPLCLSVLGGIQPAKLQKYLAQYDKSAAHDGFIERFQVSFAPDFNPDWTFVDRRPDEKARKNFFEIFHQLDSLSHENQTTFRFSRDAQSLADSWRCELEKTTHNPGLHPVLRGHFSKFRSLMPSIALIIELMDNLENASEVSLKSVEKSIIWCNTLREHAHKIYGHLTDKKNASAQIMAERIKSGRLVDGMKLRDIARKNWPLLKTSDQIEDACEILHDCHWLRLERKKIPGGTSTFVHLNPALTHIKGDSYGS